MKPYRQCVAVALLRRSAVCSPRIGDVTSRGDHVALREATVRGSPQGCSTLCDVLLVHKPRGADAWQLPQGGIEQGETPQHAAIRELQEEVGIAIPPGTTFLTTSHTYQYDYPRSFVRKACPPYRGQRVQFLGLAVSQDVKVTVDGRELDAHLWALPENLGNYIRRKEYLEVVRRVVAECYGKL